jgi:hypothetical protein
MNLQSGLKIGPFDAAPPPPQTFTRQGAKERDLYSFCYLRELMLSKKP